jgi:hypothetical protein
MTSKKTLAGNREPVAGDQVRRSFGTLRAFATPIGTARPMPCGTGYRLPVTGYRLHRIP